MRGKICREEILEVNSDMLKLLQSWEQWRKSIVRNGESYTVVSAFVRGDKVKQITLRKEQSKQYTQASKEEIDEITNR